MPNFQYVGSHNEHIVGIDAVDLSEADYDALPYDLQQAVHLNRGSGGGPLYVEVVAQLDEPAVAAPEEVAPEPPAAEATVDVNPPLDVPAEGAN